MSQCNVLFHVEKAYAYYVASEKHVVVAADVWFTPIRDQVHICPNPLQMPAGPREFVVEGTSRPIPVGVATMLHRFYYSYPSDATPKSVVVWSMGVDAPARQEVQLGAPPPPLQPQARVADAPSSAAPAAAKTTSGGVEVTGFSATYSFEEAIHDALEKALAAFPSPPRNPDVGVSITVQTISAVTGGNIRPGLTIKAIAK